MIQILRYYRQIIHNMKTNLLLLLALTLTLALLNAHEANPFEQEEHGTSTEVHGASTEGHDPIEEEDHDEVLMQHDA